MTTAWICGAACVIAGALIGAATGSRPGAHAAERVQAVSGQGSGGVLRVRGTIDRDQTWRGTVLLTEDVTLDGATVTVEPGTVIEFHDSRPQSKIKLTVGGTERSGGRLELAGTADRPIVVRTTPNGARGQIVVHVMNQVVAEDSGRAGAPLSPRPATAPPGSPRTPTSARSIVRPGVLDWRSVRFEGLGHARTDRAGFRSIRDRPVSIVDSAVEIRTGEGNQRVSLSDCVFEACHRVSIRVGAGARVEAAGNRFRAAAERVCLEISAAEGPGAAATVRVQGNHADAALVCSNIGCILEENVLIGPHASVLVRRVASGERASAVRPAPTGAIEGAIVRNNYVRCTAPDDDGHYCLSSEDPDALIEGNVLAGGTTPVLRGSRRMRGNVILGTASLKSATVRDAKTHQLVASLPAGSVFENNLLIGPAYALLIPHEMAGIGSPIADGAPPASRPSLADDPPVTVVRGNVFDGIGASSRALQLNALGRGAARVEAYDNLFLRLPTLAFDDTGGDSTLVYFDHNAAAPPPVRAFDRAAVAGRKQGAPGWSAAEKSVADVAALGLSGPIGDPPDLDAAAPTGGASVADVRARLLRPYLPTAESPLVGAGRPSASGERGTMGLSGRGP